MNTLKIGNMETINIKGFKLNLNFEPQSSKNGRLMTWCGIARNGQVAQKWIKDGYKSHWIYTFKYLDNGEFINFEFDYYDKFVGIVPNK
jgi:hypothetical protein